MNGYKYRRCFFLPFLRRIPLSDTVSISCPRSIFTSLLTNKMKYSSTPCTSSSSTSSVPQTSSSQPVEGSDNRKTYWFPPEWSIHDACIMIYPHNMYTFRLPRARFEFTNIVIAIATYGKEDVIVLCNNDDDLNIFQEQVSEINKNINSSSLDNGNIISLVCPSGDSWSRDVCPTFVVVSDQDNVKAGKMVIGLDWMFNMYGYGMHFNWVTVDQQIPSKLIPLLNEYYNTTKYEYKSCNFVLEGGSIHTDGNGTILTTEECLLNPNRNPSMSKIDIENAVLGATGCTKMIWLPTGVDGDEDTNGHIDNWACFIDDATVLLSWTDLQDEDPVNYDRCRRALSILQESKDALERNLTVHKMHLPRPMMYTKEIVDDLKEQIDPIDKETPESCYRKVGERMAGSYLNFYIANKAIIVPQFGDEIYDALAINTLRPLFTSRCVIGSPSKDILVGGGNIHCITQQIPKVE